MTSPSCFLRRTSASSFRSLRKKRAALRRGCRPRLEQLEARLLLSTLPTPNPIVPANGEQTLLHVVQMHADKQLLNAQDHFPVPFVVVASAGGAAPTVKNWKAGAPLRIDADQSKATGKGGHDIQLELNTEPYTDAFGETQWELKLNVNRIGNAPFAEDLSVVIAFPFDAFNTETTLDGPPNIVMGFETRLPGVPGTDSYKSGTDGGVVPVSVEMVLTPHVLSGTEHSFQWDITTSGDSNPLTFMGGAFDGDPLNLTPPRILNALAFSAYVADVPDNIHVDLTVGESALEGPATDSFFDIDWTASDPSLVNFTYVEAEDSFTATSPVVANFVTELVADQMPTSEHFVLHHDEAAGTLSIDHDANALIDEMTLLKRRSDGLVITAVASDVPTDVQLAPLGLAGNAVLQVDDKLGIDDNTLDMNLQVSQVGGFNSSDQFLGYDLEYVSLNVENAPDLSAAFNGLTSSFHIAASNLGERIGKGEMIIDDDGRIGADNVPTNLELPPSYADAPAHHLFSLVDDGTQGTAVARVIDAAEATFDHDAAEIKESLDMQTGQDVPLQLYLRTGVDSGILPPPGGATEPDPYVEVTCDIDDVPAGHSIITLDLPMTYTLQTESSVGALKCLGHIGYLNFGVLLGDVPTNAEFDFRPEGSVDVKALDANGTQGDESDDLPDAFGVIAVHLSEVNGFDPVILPWPTWNETFFPSGTRLKDARLRVDFGPSFEATWDDRPLSTVIDLNTTIDATLEPANPFAYIGGMQLAVSTVTDPGNVIDCDDLLEVPEATEESTHYAELTDVTGEQTLRGGIFGVDQFHFDSDDNPTTEPSNFVIDWNLDPGRPFTAASLDVDTNPVASGALGTFFGGNDVSGDLDLAYLPHQMHLTSNLDPELCTNSLFGIPFPPGIVPPIPSTIDMNFNVSGTMIVVHAEDLPQVFCVNWDVSPSVPGADQTVIITAEELDGDPSEAGLVDVLFQNTSAGGLPGSAGLFGVPLKQLRVGLNEVPSLSVGWNTGVNTHVTIDTVESSPFNILGGIRLSANTQANIPPFGPLTGSEAHYLRLTDEAADKRVEVGIFGLDFFEYSDAGNTFDVDYVGSTARPFNLDVNTDSGGKFFAGRQVTVDLDVNNLPQEFHLDVDMDPSVCYTASSGIASLNLSADIDPDGGSATNNTHVDVDISDLPAVLCFTLDPDTGASLVAETTGGFSDPVGNLTFNMTNASGIPSTGGLLGQPLKHVRARLDDIPSSHLAWSDAPNVAVGFSTDGVNAFLDGAQVAISTELGLAALPAPSIFSDHYVTLLDDGGTNLKQIKAGVFGIDEVSFTSNEATGQMTLHYDADTDRQLVVDVDTEFNGRFFPSFDIDATLTIDDVPELFDLTVDLDPVINYTASDTIAFITLVGTVDNNSGNGVDNGVNVNFLASGLPSAVNFTLNPASSASLTMNSAIDLVTFTLTSQNNAVGIFGSDFRYISAALNDIPSSWSANWGGGAFAIEANAPMGLVTAVLSATNSDSAGDQVAQRQPFTLDGPGGCRITRTAFAEEIDNRYYTASGAGGTVSPLTLLDEMYCDSEQLDPGEDHVIVRKDGGSVKFVSLEFEGFKKAAFTPDANGFNAVFEAPSVGSHPLFAGLQDGQFQTLQVEDVPDTITVDFDKTEHLNYDASGSPGEIDYYSGPLPIAGDADDATRGVILDAPSFVHLTWGFGFPSGGVNFDASNEFTLLFLTQDGSSRITAGLQMEDLQVGYGLELFSFDERGFLDIEVPVPCFDIPPICFETLFSVPVAWELVEFGVGIDNDAGDSAIDANFGKPGVDGFFNLYERKSGIQDLSGVSPPHGDQEYVPQITVMLDEFRELDINVALVLDPLAEADGVILAYVFPVSLILDVTLHGDPVFDVWVNDDIDEGFTIPLVDYDIGFVNHPDYKENSPIHVLPIESFFGGIGIDHDAVITFSGFHGFGEHTDPFEALVTPLATESGSDNPLDASQIGSVLNQAGAYWISQGFDASMVSSIAVADVVISNLPGGMLGSASGGRLRLDVDAAGYGWSLDSGPRAGGIDLLSTATHEIGHLLGLRHSDSGLYDVMSPTLRPGEQRLPSSASGILAGAYGGLTDQPTQQSAMARFAASGGLTWLLPLTGAQGSLHRAEHGVDWPDVTELDGYILRTSFGLSLQRNEGSALRGLALREYLGTTSDDDDVFGDYSVPALDEELIEMIATDSL